MKHILNSSAIIAFVFLLLTSCQSDTKSLAIDDLDLEVTTPQKEAYKDSLIISNINDFLISDSSAIVRNYFFLCDSSRINTFREYDVNHKNENIRIGMGKEDATIRPLPGSYSLNDGPVGEFKIFDDSLGQMHSYVLEVELSEDFEIESVNAILRFTRTKNGVRKMSFKRVIAETEPYLIEKRVEDQNW